MKSTRSASRYAKALMDLAVERNEVETVKNDVLLAQKAVADTRDLQIFLASPVVKPKVKQKVLGQIFDKHVSELTMHFVLLIVQHNRERALEQIFQSFMLQYRESKNTIEARFITSAKVSDGAVKAIQEKLGKALGKTVEVIEEVDEDLIGGFVVETDNYRLDESIAGKMRKLKRELTK